MTATYFGRASAPADSGAQFNDSGGVAMVPPASMLAGDLVLLPAMFTGDGTSSLSMVAGDGQTWNNGTNQAFGTPDFIVSRLFWARFNGTWGANPKVLASTVGSFLTQSEAMIVFRPTNAANTWAVDVAESGALFAAPGGSFDVTVTGQTAIAASTITLAWWIARGAIPTWTLQTGGWANPSSVAQIRNTGNSDISVSQAYLIQSAPGATGNVTNRMSSDRAGFKSIVTFKEVSAAAANSPNLMLLGVG